MNSDNRLTHLTEEDNIDIKRYLSLFLSNWYWFAIGLFISVTLVYGINKYSEKIYTVSSTILIKDDQLGGTGSGIESFLPGGDLFKSRQNLRNEIGILQSYTLNRRVIDSLPLFHVTYVSIGKRNIAENRMYTNCPFIVIPTDSVLQPRTKVSVKINSEKEYRITINEGRKEDTALHFGHRYDKNGFDFTIALRNPESFEFKPEMSNKFTFQFTSLDGLANQYRRKLVIKTIDEDASILSLSLSGPVAAQEADYLNKLMQLYIKQGLELKTRIADSTINFIERQISVIDSSLQLAEKELLEFRGMNNLIDISREGVSIQSKLDQYETEKVKTQLQLQYYS